MKVVLVRPSYHSYFITPPIGLGYLASYLKKNKITAKIIDGLRDNNDNRALLERILKEKPDAVGITCLTAFYNEAVGLSQMLKRSNKEIRVIFGGVHPTALPAETLKDSNADFVICGEGETALLKLIEKGFVSDGIPGVYSQTNIEQGKNFGEKAEIIDNLDDIPFPDWEQINPGTYPLAPHGVIVRNSPIGVVTTTRGCPYQCTFCASPGFYDRKIRYRTPENVLEEIKYLVNRFGVKEIHFEDDNLTLERTHAKKICNLILKEKIKISWACPNGIRADKTDEELLRLMKKSGCYYLSYGIESASNRILENVKKHETIETIEKSIELANKAGILTSGFIILGLPGETKETLSKTIGFLKKTKLFRVTVVMLAVLPGTELWNKLKGKLVPGFSAKNTFAKPQWIPEGLKEEELIKAQKHALNRFYANPARILKLIVNTKPQQIKYFFRVFRYFNTLRNAKD